MHYEKFQDGSVKCIEDEIPFEVPEGWAWERLGNLTSIIQYGLNNSAQKSGTHRLLRITDIQNGKVNWESVPFTTIHESSQYVLVSGDIVFARTGATVGKSFLITDLPYPSVFASYLIRIQLIKDILPQYIYQFFNSKCYWNQITNKLVGVGQPNCNGTSLKELFIPLPPQKEQMRILSFTLSMMEHVTNIEQKQDGLRQCVSSVKSKILDLAICGKLIPQNPDDEPASVLLEHIREEKEKLIKAGKIKQDKNESIIFRGADSSYYEKFADGTIKNIDEEIPFEIPDNWAFCRLDTLFNVCSAKRIKKSDWRNTGIPFYRAREIVKLSEEGFVKNELFISEKYYNQIKDECNLPQDGDLMVSGVGTIGKIYVVTSNDVFYYKDASVLCFENRSGAITSDYARFMLESSFVQKQMRDNTKGTTVDTITISQAKQYLCILPPLNEQKRIVIQLKQIFNIIDILINNSNY